jgi:uncharacterized protein YndB with AHSA1/START domain
MKKIDINTDVPYPIEKVWQALTDSALMSQWLMETDFKPDVGYQFRFKGKANKFWRGYVECKVVTIEPLKRIQFTWQNAEKQTPTTITYELQKTDSGTSIHATNAGFDNTYGPFSGFFYRTMIKAGMKKEFSVKLPKVLAKI